MKVYAQVRNARDGALQTSAPVSTKASSQQNSLSSGAGSLMLGVFLFVFVVWFGITFALVYHFKKYAGGDPKVKLAQAIYIAGSLFLLAAALFSLA
jgi:hypothetical protein